MGNIIDSIVNFFTTYVIKAGIKIVVAVAIVAIGFYITSFITRKLREGKLSAKVDPSVHTFIVNFINISLKVIIIVTAAAYLGVPMASVVAVVGSAGVAIGLALQGGLSNIAGGLMILLFKPFGVGDFIEASGKTGKVTDIGMFYTTLTTPDNCHVVMPNSVVTGGTVVNYSAEDTRRVDIDFSVGYECDSEKVRDILNRCVSRTDGILADKPADIFLTTHGDSAIIFQLRVWCATADYWTVKFALIESVKAEFDHEGISIPYNQLDVHIKKGEQ